MLIIKYLVDANLLQNEMEKWIICNGLRWSYTLNLTQSFKCLFSVDANLFRNKMKLRSIELDRITLSNIIIKQCLISNKMK